MTRPSLFLLSSLLFCALHLRADLEIFTKRDTIVLNDGSEIACRILMITEKGVLIVESDPSSPDKKSQRIISRDKVRSIIRDERNGAIEGLATDTEFARKVIKGAHKDEPKDEDEAAPKPTRKTAKSKTPLDEPAKPAANSVANAKDSPAKPGPAAPAGGKDVKVEMPKGTLNGKDLTDAYFARYPELRDTGMDLLGTNQIQDWLNSARDGNESARKPIESMLKAYIGTGDKEAKATSSGAVPPRLRRVTPKAPQVDEQ